MNGFAKGHFDAERFSDHRRRDIADRELKQAEVAVFQLRPVA